MDDVGEEVVQSNPSPTTTPKRKIVRADVSDPPVPDHELIAIYRWLDSVEFSRAKKTSTHRDFADGVMMAELIAYHVPKIINIANYTATSSTSKKRANWEHLNSAVFRRIRFIVSSALLKAVSEGQPGMIEKILRPLHLILMLGPVAVSCIPKKLEQVKSRYMEIPKRVPITAKSSDVSQKSSSQSAPLPSPNRPRSSPISKKSIDKTPRPRQAGSKFKSGVMEAKSGIPCPLKGKLSQQNPSAASSVTTPDKENVEGKSTQGENFIETRPVLVTPKAFDESQYNKGPHTFGAYEAEPSSGNRFETNWSQLESGEKKASMWPLGKGEMEGFQMESGNSELTERDDEEELDLDDVNDEFEDDDIEIDSNKNPKQKNKIKRVVKYEYREELIFNGLTTASTTCSTPTPHDLRENCKRSTNKDSKFC